MLPQPNFHLVGLGLCLLYSSLRKLAALTQPTTTGFYWGLYSSSTQYYETVRWSYLQELKCPWRYLLQLWLYSFILLDKIHIGTSIQSLHKHMFICVSILVIKTLNKTDDTDQWFTNLLDFISENTLKYFINLKHSN